MNIAIVTTWFERGAAYVSKQYADLLKENHNIFIYARGGELFELDKNSIWMQYSVTHDTSKQNGIPTFIDLKLFENFLLQNNIESVFFNEQHWWHPVLLCKDLGIKTGSYIDYYTEETLPFFDIFDFIVCNTQKHKKAFDKHTEAYFVPWGSDIEVFKPNSLEIVNDNYITFFHSCGMGPNRKGTDLLIKASSSIKENFKLIIHSQLDLKEFYPELKETMEQLIKEKKLEIIEKTVTAPGLYHLGDVYVYPTRLEGIGLTMAEAMLCGLPIIVPDEAPMNEFSDVSIYNKKVKVDKLYCRKDGYYWPMCEVDIEDLRKNIIGFIEQKHKIKDIKNETRDIAVQNFNWNNNVEVLNEIFETATIKVINKQLKNKIVFFENKRFPFSERVSFFYRLKFLFKEMIKKVLDK